MREKKFKTSILGFNSKRETTPGNKSCQLTPYEISVFKPCDITRLDRFNNYHTIKMMPHDPQNAHSWYGEMTKCRMKVQLMGSSKYPKKER